MIRPILYADDLWSDVGYRSDSDTFLARILPIRCPIYYDGPSEMCGCMGPLDRDETPEPCERHACPKCGGRGWLYPDPPDAYVERVKGWGEQIWDSWHEQLGGTWVRFVEAQWTGFCEEMWRAMGIVGETEEVKA